jgi:hypothetical protein
MNDEYKEGLATLGEAGMVYYKFLNLFRVTVKDDELAIRFGHSCLDTEELRREELLTFRQYLKEQKEWIRTTRGADPKELQRRMWWIVEKILEFGFFTSSDQKTIMFWLDICLSRLADSNSSY